MARDSILERLFKAKLEEIAKVLGVERSKLEEFDKKLSRKFWKNVVLKEVYSAKLKYPEVYMLRLMETYTFAHYGSRQYNTEKLRHKIVKLALENKRALVDLPKLPKDRRIQKALEKGILPETTFPYTRAYVIEHKELGPIGLAGINPGKIHELSMLVVHPIGSDKELENAMGGKLDVGSVLMLYTLYKHSKLQLLANKKSLGLIRKLERELGLKGFKVAKQKSQLVEFSEVEYRRPKRKINK